MHVCATLIFKPIGLNSEENLCVIDYILGQYVIYHALSHTKSNLSDMRVYRKIWQSTINLTKFITHTKYHLINARARPERCSIRLNIFLAFMRS